MNVPKGQYAWTATVGEKGQIVIPKQARDVFGAMGSWNDSPEWIAREKGLQEKYYDLSHDLYVSTRKAVMNAING